jgi:hypothetical protein
MSRLLFLLYCVAAWEVGLFEPLLSINLLMFGAAFVLRRQERQAAKAVGETHRGRPRAFSSGVRYPP